MTTAAQLCNSNVNQAWRSGHESGFAYVALLIAISIIGIAAATAVQIGSVLQRRSAEEELLAIGQEYRAALISYANATPAGQSSYPSSLDALLRDPRYPVLKRHLRKIYFDPMTGKQSWGTIPSPDAKGIVGVFSLSTDRPMKIANFEPIFKEFENKESYADWVFTSIEDTKSLQNRPKSSQP